VGGCDLQSSDLGQGATVNGVKNLRVPQRGGGGFLDQLDVNDLLKEHSLSWS
jgi:hypothetical protein